MDPSIRQRELEELARARGVELDRLADLPDDPRLRLAALATLLGLDARLAAFQPEVSVPALEAMAQVDEAGLEEHRKALAYQERE